IIRERARTPVGRVGVIPLLIDAYQIIEGVILIVRFIAEISACIWLPYSQEASKSIGLIAPPLPGFVGYGDYRKLRIIRVDMTAIGVRDLGSAAQDIISEAIPHRSSGVGRAVVGVRQPTWPLIRIGLV